MQIKSIDDKNQTLNEVLERAIADNSENLLVDNARIAFKRLGVLEYLGSMSISGLKFLKEDKLDLFVIELQDGILTVTNDFNHLTLDFESNRLKDSEIYSLIQRMYDGIVIPQTIHYQITSNIRETDTNIWLELGRVTVH